MKNKFKAILASDTFRSIISAVICALVGIIVGFIILLIINAEHAPKAISVILKNFLYYRNNGKKQKQLNSVASVRDRTLDYPFTFSLNALPALKTGVLLAANCIASPVEGLRP